jgi:hypothetical protein
VTIAQIKDRYGDFTGHIGNPDIRFLLYKIVEARAIIGPTYCSGHHPALNHTCMTCRSQKLMGDTE